MLSELLSANTKDDGALKNKETGRREHQRIVFFNHQVTKDTKVHKDTGGNHDKDEKGTKQK
jgi:hypothetical protein